MKTKLAFVLGTGGVGKTTLSAAWAVAEADQGRRTALLTVDPARRLADALGVDLGDRPQSVRDVTGLDAWMLDPRSAFDTWLEGATSPAHRAAIVQNRVYQAFAGSLARSHAYAAMEQLGAVMDSNGYERVIVDTPPSRNALELIAAPEALARLLDAKVLRALLGSGESNLMEKGSRFALAWLSRLLGRGLWAELLTFLELFMPLRHDLTRRATTVSNRIVAPETERVLVLNSDEDASGSADRFVAQLQERGAPPTCLWANRAFSLNSDGEPWLVQPTETPLSFEPPNTGSLGEEEAMRLVAMARKHTDWLVSRSRSSAKRIAQIAQDHDIHVIRSFPLQAFEPSDVNALRQLWSLSRPDFHVVEVNDAPRR